MRQVDLVLVVGESACECKRIVTTAALALVLVLEVTNVLSSAVPTEPRQFCLLLRINEGLHTLVVAALRLDEVYEVELIDDALLHVRDPEVVPLRINGLGVVILLENQIILVLAYFDGSAKIARLESTFKYQCRVVLALFLVVRPQLRVVPVGARSFLVE